MKIKTSKNVGRISSVLELRIKRAKNFVGSGHLARGRRKWPDILSLTVSVLGLVLSLFTFTTINTVGANNLPVVEKNGVLYVDETWQSGAVYMITNTLTIPQGVTLTIEEGTVVKTQGHNAERKSIKVQQGGTLNALGTAQDPIIFTSYKDDSYGGDSNNDGVSSGGFRDYFVSITVEGGEFTAAHGIFRYADRAIEGGSGASISVTDSEFSEGRYGVYVGSWSTAELALERNHFNLNGGEAAIYAQRVTDLSTVVLSGTNKNTFAGNLPDTLIDVKDSQVPSGKTWTVPDIWMKANNLTVSGTLNLTEGTMLESSSVTVDGTLNMDPGTVVKTQGHNAERKSIKVQQGGTLNALGTAQDPIIFTSYKDDSYGGDSNNDGVSSGGFRDYFVSITVEGGEFTAAHGIFRYADRAIEGGSGASISVTDSEFSEGRYGVYVGSWSTAELALDTVDVTSIEHPFYIRNTQARIMNTSISNAITGLNVSGSSRVIFRGDFSNISGRIIESCKWGESCAVDASYVNWGSADGPFASNPADNLACGAVSVTPWVYGGNTYTYASNPNLYSIRNCDNSPTPEVWVDNSISAFSAGVANKQIDCGNGYQDACDAIQSAYACLGGAMSVAQSTTPWPLPGASTGTQVAAFGGLIRESAATYMTSQAIVSPSGFGLSFFNQLIGVSGTMITIASAYNACIPN